MLPAQDTKFTQTVQIKIFGTTFALSDKGPDHHQKSIKPHIIKKKKIILKIMIILLFLL